MNSDPSAGVDNTATTFNATGGPPIDRHVEAEGHEHNQLQKQMNTGCGRVLQRMRVSVRVAIVGLVAVCVMLSAVPQITIWWWTAKTSTDIATEFLMRSIKNESVSVFTQICDDSERVVHQFELAAQRNPLFCEDRPELLDFWRESLDTMMVPGRELEFAGYGNTHGYQCSVYGRGPQPFYKLTKPILWRQDPRKGDVNLTFNNSYMSWYMEWNETSSDWYIGATTGQNSTLDNYYTLRRGWYNVAIRDSSLHWDGPDLSLPEIFLCLSLSKSWSPKNHPEKKCGVIILQVSLTNIGSKLAASRVRSSNIWIVSNDKDWTIVATSRNVSTELYQPGGKVVRMPIALSEDVLTSSVGKAARGLSESQKLGTLQRTEVLGETYLMYVELVDIRPGTGYPPVYVIIADPESDFFSGITKSIGMTIGITVAMVFACAALSVVVAVLVSSPLRFVVRQMERASRLEKSEVRPHNNTMQAGLTEVASIYTSMHKMWTLLGSFHKYVPIEVLRILQLRGEIAKLSVSRHRCSTLFCDIENFTVMTENTDPDILLTVFTDFMDMCTKAIDDNHGLVDKFIGDCVMAFWGYPGEAVEMEMRVCLTGLAIMENLGPLRAKWDTAGLPKINCRVGMSTGDVLVGNSGSSNHFHYTVLGNSVNLAARLEPMNKFFGTRMLICSATRAAVGDRIVARHVGHVRVKGFAQVQEIYELVGSAERIDPAALRRTTLFNEAMDDLDTGCLDLAKKKIEEYLALGSAPEPHALKFIRKIDEAQQRGHAVGEENLFIFDLSAGV
eukprot:m51a1_g10480 hypothetical protein (785) ;mRNA; r:38415-41145